MSNRRRLVGRALTNVVFAGWLVLGVVRFADGAWVSGLFSLLVAVCWAVVFFSPRRVRSGNT